MTHVVVAIIKRENPLSYLLVSSKKDHGEYSGFYYPPGGHVENGEDELSALKRELKEELGVDVTQMKKLSDTEGDIKDQKTSWYICDIDSDQFTYNKDELRDAGFFTQQEMETMNIWPATQNVFNGYIFSTK